MVTRHARKAFRAAALLMIASLLLLACSRAGVAVGDGEASPAIGRGLFAEHCARCHGADGVPIVGGTFDLRRYSRSFDRFDSALDIGPGPMPGFPQLDRGQRQALYAHVLTLR